MREFRKSVGKSTEKTGRSQVWRIGREGDAVKTEWGVLNGAMQTTTEVYEGNNIGKKNEKSPEQIAQEDLERKVEDRLEKGWVEVDPKTGKVITTAEVITSIDWVSLPKNLRFAKPNSQPKDKKLLKLIEDKQALWTRKRDGMQHSLLFTKDGEWKMYSSLMAPGHKDEPDIPWLQRYPSLHQALKQLKVPRKTILVGEMVSAASVDEEGFDIDSLKHVGQVTRSKFDEAMMKQAAEGELVFCAFDIPFWDGKPWYQEMIISRRFGAIHELVQSIKHPNLSHVEIFMPGEVVRADGRELCDFDGSRVQAMEIARSFGWEGFVVYDPMGHFGNRGISFAGKPERPPTAAKVKLTEEADFVVYWDPENGQGKWGKGKKAMGVGSVQAYLYNELMELVPIAMVGGGLSDEQVFKFADPSLYPMVWKVEFMRWTPDGSIREPRFVCVREGDDAKEPEHCTTAQMPGVTETGEFQVEEDDDEE